MDFLVLKKTKVDSQSYHVESSEMQVSPSYIEAVRLRKKTVSPDRLAPPRYVSIKFFSTIKESDEKITIF